MPLFFFHLRKDGQLSEDEEGLDLPNLDAARAEADASAREMLADSIKGSHGGAPDAIVVCDAKGTQVYEVALAAFLPRSRH
jgi:uncharacterized protein DUF6894